MSAIPFTFHHHLDGDMAAFYIEEYRNCYTYPTMEKKKMAPSSNQQPAKTVKPTLYILGDNARLPHEKQVTPLVIILSIVDSPLSSLEY
jgi:hypothetical protein